MSCSPAATANIRIASRRSGSLDGGLSPTELSPSENAEYQIANETEEPYKHPGVLKLIEPQVGLREFVGGEALPLGVLVNLHFYL